MIAPPPVISLESLLLWNALAAVGLWFALRFILTWLAQVLFDTDPPRKHP